MNRWKIRGMKALGIAGALVLIMAGTGFAEDKPQGGDAKKGPPPALVVTASAVEGTAEAMSEFVGSVFFSRVSDVAAEVEGIVEEAAFEEGHRVAKDTPLVRLGTDLLDITIDGTRGTYEQLLVDLEKAKKDLARMEALFKEQSIAETVYDETLFKARGLEKRAIALKAVMDRLIREREKKTIFPPFEGVVISRAVEEGEWVPVGGTVAVLADDREVDVVVDLPEEALGFIRKGRRVQVQSGGQTLDASYFAVIPKGDLATRTFSVKFRLKNTTNLLEAMEARVLLPSGPRREGILVPRDAVITQFGQTVVFAVVDGAAKMIPVSVTGYEGDKAAVSGPGLGAGTEVVVKGNERIRDGQPVTVKQ